MSDFSSLQAKVNDLKAKVAQNSVTPVYLGTLLDDFIAQMQAIDLTGLSDVQLAINNSKEALLSAQSALSKSGAAETAASSALQNALFAIEKANSALQAAAEAKATAADADAVAKSAKEVAINAGNTAGTAAANAADAQSRIAAIEDAVAAPSGIASLDNEGHVVADQLPADVHDVLLFAGFSDGSMVVNPRPADAAGDILYQEYTKTFIFRVTDEDGSVKYFGAWPGAEAFGTAGLAGRKPISNKLYIDASSNKQYRWDGAKLVVVGSNLALGESEGSAFSGAEGRKLRQDVSAISTMAKSTEQLAKRTEQAVAQHVASVGILDFVGYVDAADDVMTAETQGDVYFATVDKKFVIAGDYSADYPEEYNTFDVQGNCLAPRTDRIFRLKTSLFRFDDTKNKLVEIGGKATVRRRAAVDTARPILRWGDLPAHALPGNAYRVPKFSKRVEIDSITGEEKEITCAHFFFGVTLAAERDGFDYGRLFPGGVYRNKRWGPESGEPAREIEFNYNPSKTNSVIFHDREKCRIFGFVSPCSENGVFGCYRIEIIVPGLESPVVTVAPDGCLIPTDSYVTMPLAEASERLFPNYIKISPDDEYNTNGELNTLYYTLSQKNKLPEGIMFEVQTYKKAKVRIYTGGENKREELGIARKRWGKDIGKRTYYRIRAVSNHYPLTRWAYYVRYKSEDGTQVFFKRVRKDNT